VSKVTEYREFRRAIGDLVDVGLFMEFYDPDWKDHYKCDKYIAFDLYTYYMDKVELIKSIDEAEAWW